MKIKLPILLLLLCLSITIAGQDKTALKYASKIDSTYIKKSLAVLASDEFEGRGTAQEGGLKTEKYIANHLQRMGLKTGNNKSYFQDIEAAYRKTGTKSFIVNGDKHDGDYSFQNNRDTIITTDEVVFAGYGTYSGTYNDFADINVTDKVVMIMSGTPTDKFGNKYCKGSVSSSYLTSQKPKAIITINQNFNSFNSYSDWESLEFSRQYPTIPSVTVNERLANKILEPTGKTVKEIAFTIEKEGQPWTKNIHTPISFSGNYVYRDADVNNVIGLIEGTDLKNEYVVISAHHDHEGKVRGEIYNGADDNASGVASVLEMARIFAQAKKDGKGPRRSIIVLFPAAEEKGLIGSLYYANNPTYPLAQTVANVNIDMVGRLADAYQDKSNNYIYVVNHKKMSGDLVSLLETINGNSLKLNLDYKYTSPGDDERFFHRSDQYNLAEKRIPAIMLTSGTHDDYHTPADDTDKIDFDGIWKRTKLAFLLTWELANSNTKPTLQ